MRCLQRLPGAISVLLNPLILLLLSPITEANVSALLSAAFKHHQVVPDVLDSPPVDAAAVSFGGKLQAKFGNVLTPKQTRKQPAVAWHADPKSFYALIMVDPDAPSRKKPTIREFLHWMVVNIPGTKVGQGSVMAPYAGAGPPKGTGLHRYVLLVYKQPAKIWPYPKYSELDRRVRFRVAAFAKSLGLGRPVAGNFFQSQYNGSY